MNGRPLDEESFTQLLAAACVVQEHQDRAREKAVVPPSDFAQIISRIVDTQHLIQTRSLDAQAALDLIAAQMQKLSGAAGCAIGLLLNHVLHYKAAVGSASILLGFEIPEDVCLSARCLKKGEKLVSPLCEGDPQIDQAFRRRVKAQSLIAVPIYHEGTARGALEVFFRDVGAFSEGDVRACELMAGLVTEVMAQTAEQELKQELATERASVLLALEKLKPQLEELAGEAPRTEKPAQSAPTIPAPHPTGVRVETEQLEGEQCPACGNALLEDPTGCSRCGWARNSDAQRPRMWGRLAKLQPKDRPGAIAPGPVLQSQAREAKTMAARAPFDFQSLPPIDELLKTAAGPGEEAAVDVESDEDSSVESVAADGRGESPWSSAARAKDWLKAHVQEKTWNFGDVSLGLSAVVFLVVLIWGLWPQEKPEARPAPQAQAAMQGPVIRRRPKPKPPELTLFERALIGLGLAEPPPAPQYMGNPAVKVWVDLQTALYYCPGTDLYGSTGKGKYTTQADAQQDQFEPAYRKPCD
jgi:GAF domain-containing protein